MKWSQVFAINSAIMMGASFCAPTDFRQLSAFGISIVWAVFIIILANVEQR